MQRNEKQRRRLSSFLTSIAVTYKFIASNCMLNIHKVDLIYTATLKVFNYCKIKNDTFFWVFFIPQHFITIEQYKCVSDSLIITIRNRFFLMILSLSLLTTNNKENTFQGLNCDSFEKKAFFILRHFILSTRVLAKAFGQNSTFSISYVKKRLQNKTNQGFLTFS